MTSFTSFTSLYHTIPTHSGLSQDTIGEEDMTTLPTVYLLSQTWPHYLISPSNGINKVAAFTSVLTDFISHVLFFQTDILNHNAP